MSRQQGIVLACMAAAIFTLLLFPPFHYEAAQGACIQGGYHFVLNPPGGRRGATVDTGTLLTLWAGVLLVGGLVYLILGASGGKRDSTDGRDSGDDL